MAECNHMLGLKESLGMDLQPIFNSARPADKKFTHGVDEKFNFCPECGADLTSVHDEIEEDR